MGRLLHTSGIKDSPSNILRQPESGARDIKPGKKDGRDRRREDIHVFQRPTLPTCWSSLGVMLKIKLKKKERGNPAITRRNKNHNNHKFTVYENIIQTYKDRVLQVCILDNNNNNNNA